MRSRTRLAGALLALWTVVGHAGGAALSVAPIRLDLASGERAGVLEIGNGADQPVDVQMRVVHWSQTATTDEYTAADDVVVSPARSRIEAHGHQTARVYLRSDSSAATQRTFRVLIDQLPDATSARSGAVDLPLRLVLPLFAGGEAAPSPRLEWKARRERDRLVLDVNNDGARTVRMSALSAFAPGDAAPAQQRLVYVLPGARRTIEMAWPDGLAAGASQVALRGDGDAGPVNETVALAPDR